jgi:predicted Zn-dependent protease
MGHVMANHAQQREQEAAMTLVAQQAVSKAGADSRSQQLALAASERTLAAYSRQQELEADAIGIKTIGDAGYDPYAAARFLTAMAKFGDYRNATAKEQQPPDFLATHPSTPERVTAATQQAQAFGAPGVGDTGRDRYLDGIDGMIFGDDPAKGFVRDRNFLDPNLSIGFTVPDGFVLDNSSEAVLATGNDGTALRFDAITPTTPMDLPTYLRSGWVNGLDASSLTTSTIGGFTAASARAQAKGWYFQIVVLQAQSGAIYRFIFANAADTAAFRATANATVGTFRTLTPAEMTSLKPLHVVIVTAAKGDSEVSLAKRMHGVGRGRDLFDVMNNLTPGAAIAPGTRLKIVTDS